MSVENKDKTLEDRINELTFIVKSSKSLEIVETISDMMLGNTFHHHFHLLFDLRTCLGASKKVYMEIGTFHGASACLMMQHLFETEIHCIDPCEVEPDQYETMQQNLSTFNHYNRTLTVHKTYSNDKQLLESLHKSGFRADILFIDGDHSAKAVRSDFELYQGFVNPGGYIVFDDYMDNVYCTELHAEVDNIVKDIEKNALSYHIIGSIENCRNAYACIPMPSSNEFILQKKDV